MEKVWTLPETSYPFGDAPNVFRVLQQLTLVPKPQAVIGPVSGRARILT